MGVNPRACHLAVGAAAGIVLPAIVAIVAGTMTIPVIAVVTVAAIVAVSAVGYDPDAVDAGFVVGCDIALSASAAIAAFLDPAARDPDQHAHVLPATVVAAVIVAGRVGRGARGSVGVLVAVVDGRGDEQTA